MNENIAKKNEALAQTVIKGLESRNMTGFYAASKEDALKTALSLIPENSTIAMGGCTSATEIGLIDALKNGKYNYIDRAQMEPRAGLMAAYDADIFFTAQGKEILLRELAGEKRTDDLAAVQADDRIDLLFIDIVIGKRGGSDIGHCTFMLHAGDVEIMAVVRVAGRKMPMVCGQLQIVCFSGFDDH